MVPSPTTTTTVPTDKSGTTPRPEKQCPPFAITLPAFMLSVATFTDAWEYDDEGGDGVIDDGYAIWLRAADTLLSQIGLPLVEVERKQLWEFWRGRQRLSILVRKLSLGGGGT